MEDWGDHRPPSTRPASWGLEWEAAKGADAELRTGWPRRSSKPMPAQRTLRCRIEAVGSSCLQSLPGRNLHIWHDMPLLQSCRVEMPSECGRHPAACVQMHGTMALMSWRAHRQLHAEGSLNKSSLHHDKRAARALLGCASCRTPSSHPKYKLTSGTWGLSGAEAARDFPWGDQAGVADELCRPRPEVVWHAGLLSIRTALHLPGRALGRPMLHRHGAAWGCLLTTLSQQLWASSPSVYAARCHHQMLHRAMGQAGWPLH